MFIVFDGVDGAGKSTQIKLCHQWLRQSGFDVEEVSDPGTTKLGKRIREILLGNQGIPIDQRSEMLLFMAARSQLVTERIRPAIKHGSFVLCDRFLLSTVVYQGHAGEIDPETIWQVGQIATGGLEPDMTLVFDLPVDVAFDRLAGEKDRLESRGREYFEAVREGFLREAENDERIVVIDARLSAEELHHEICRLLARRFAIGAGGKK